MASCPTVLDVWEPESAAHLAPQSLDSVLHHPALHPPSPIAFLPILCPHIFGSSLSWGFRHPGVRIRVPFGGASRRSPAPASCPGSLSHISSYYNCPPRYSGYRSPGVFDTQESESGSRLAAQVVVPPLRRPVLDPSPIFHSCYNSAPRYSGYCSPVVFDTQESESGARLAARARLHTRRHPLLHLFPMLYLRPQIFRLLFSWGFRHPGVRIRCPFGGASRQCPPTLGLPLPAEVLLPTILDVRESAYCTAQPCIPVVS
ncbi:hypothetical protein BDZ89DRAFT_260857 [Hymenopellis radicata]|nr:hypothetical protein BDZ89DRAFT_260857 [Hymenopellis radicata]